MMQAVPVWMPMTTLPRGGSSSPHGHARFSVASKKFQSEQIKARAVWFDLGFWAWLSLWLTVAAAVGGSVSQGHQSPGTFALAVSIKGNQFHLIDGGWF